MNQRARKSLTQNRNPELFMRFTSIIIFPNIPVRGVRLAKSGVWMENEGETIKYRDLHKKGRSSCSSLFLTPLFRSGGNFLSWELVWWGNWKNIRPRQYFLRGLISLFTAPRNNFPKESNFSGHPPRDRDEVWKDWPGETQRNASRSEGCLNLTSGWILVRKLM